MGSEPQVTGPERSRPDTGMQGLDSGSQFKYRAYAFGFIALVFAALFLVDMVVPDPVPLVEEIAFLLGSIFSGRASLNAAS